MKTLSIAMAFAVSVVGATMTTAETAEQKGLRIAQAVSDGERGYQDHSVDGEMILRSKAGRTSKRVFGSRSVDMGANKGTRTLLIFEKPGDIRNTALLTHTHVNKRDDQWLYLPAVSKTRRISSSGRSGSFVGSEFAYEDMADFEVSKYTYRWIKDERCPTSGQCHVVDRFPKQSSGYSSQRIWVDTRNKRIQAVQYFDRRKAHLKTLIITGYRQYSGKFWRASKMKMDNHLTGKSTTLTWKNHQFNRGANVNDFTVNALKRLK